MTGGRLDLYLDQAQWREVTLSGPKLPPQNVHLAASEMAKMPHRMQPGGHSVAVAWVLKASLHAIGLYPGKDLAGLLSSSSEIELTLKEKDLCLVQNQNNCLNLLQADRLQILIQQLV